MSNSTVVVTSKGTTAQTTIATTAPATSTPDHTTSTDAVATSSVIASSAAPSTQVFTSVITQSQSGTSYVPPETVVITSVSTPTDTSAPSSAVTSTTSTTSALGSTQNKGSGNGGLSAGGKTAIAVVIPIFVVAMLAIAGIFLWRRRNRRKSDEEQRKKEMEEYGYNPNHDPTLPAVAATDEIAEDTGGYRGWGTATGSAGRKTSTTMSGGHQHSDGGGYTSPGSPTQATMSDQNSGEPLVGHSRSAAGSDTIGALTAAPAAATNRNGDIRRGPSNASSSYSAGNHSNHSSEAPIPVHNPQDYYTENGYYQPGPYDNPYGAQGGPQPIIRDNPARRNTRIQEAPYSHQHQGQQGGIQGGIAQNF